MVTVESVAYGIAQIAQQVSGSRAPLPEPSPLRTGHDDCSSSGSSLGRFYLGGTEDPVLDTPYDGLRRGPVHAGPRYRLSSVGLFGSHRLTSPTGTGVHVHGFR